MAVEMIGWGAAIDEGRSDQVIVFVSGWGRGEEPSFHFAGYAERFAQTKLFLRNRDDCHYLDGIPGITHGEDETLRFLEYIAHKIGASRLTFVSGSVGSHATMRWASALGAQDVHLIGPVTDVDHIVRTDRAHQPDFRGLIEYFARSRAAPVFFTDLRPFMLDHADRVGCVDIYYSELDAIDNFHARNIADVPNVRSTIYREGNHFRVPVYVQRRDPDLTDRINDSVVARPVELRRADATAETDLGYAKVCYE